MAKKTKPVNKQRTRSPTDFDKRLGAILNRERKARGISQNALGTTVGVTWQQMQKYLSGENRMCVSRFVDVCRAIGVTPAEMISGAIS